MMMMMVMMIHVCTRHDDVRHIIIMPNQVFSISNALPTHDEGYEKNQHCA